MWHIFINFFKGLVNNISVILSHLPEEEEKKIFFSFVGLEFNSPVNTITGNVISSWSVYLTMPFLGRLCPLSN